MRFSIGLLAIVLGMTICSAARAQDPMTYDPTFYDYYDYYNPANPHSPWARYLYEQRLKKQKEQTVLVKMENFAKGVGSGVATGVYRVVTVAQAINNPNNSIPNITTGPGSPLQQPGSLSGTATDAMKPTPTPAPLFVNPTSAKNSLFGNLFGPPTASGAVLGKQP
jgi:hypothetical protein